MKEDKFKTKDLLKDLERIRPFNDNRVLIWYCNLYNEHLVKLIYSKYKNESSFGFCNECKKTLEPSFLLKVDELSSAGYIDSENQHNDLIKMIYKARNSAGHELNFNETRIIKSIEKQMSVAKMEDPSGKLSKLFKNISPWKKLEIQTAVVVAKLNETFEMINSQECEERLIFEINPEYTVVSPIMIDRNDARF